MRITHLRAHNFRSICDTSAEIGPLLVLVGPNNHGKSNILAAIEFVLQSSSKVSAEDFCAFRSTQDQTLWVELTFAELTEQERTTFARYVDPSGSFTVRKQATLSGDDVDVTYHGYVAEPSEWWLREGAFDRLGTREDIQREAATVAVLAPLLEVTGRITKAKLSEFQADYIRANRDTLTLTRRLEEGPFLGTKNVAAGTLPDFYLIPAVRDVGEEMRTKGTTAFGRLLQRAIAEMTDRDPRIAEIRKRVSSLVDELNERTAQDENDPPSLATLEATIAKEIGGWDVKVGIRVVPPELEKLFELGTELRIDDGHETTAERKGHGLQRAILFGLVRAWAQVLRNDPGGPAVRPRKASESVIFAFEEPELFLHPHAQRVLYRALRDIAKIQQHQVLLCTHSTHFVSLDDYRAIAIASKESPSAGTTIRQFNGDLFTGDTSQEQKQRFHMAMWINPDRGELFFARKVVLVEGETEKAVLPYVAERLGCFDPSISIVDCGSKHNLPLYVKVLNAFRIPYSVVHDEDPLPDPIPDSWHEDRIKAKRSTFSMNATIAGAVNSAFGNVILLSPDFEGACGVSRNQGEKKGKALAALDHFAKLSDDELPGELVALCRNSLATGFIPLVLSGSTAVPVATPSGTGAA